MTCSPCPSAPCRRLIPSTASTSPQLPGRDERLPWQAVAVRRDEILAVADPRPTCAKRSARISSASRSFMSPQASACPVTPLVVISCNWLVTPQTGGRADYNSTVFDPDTNSPPAFSSNVSLTFL